MAVHLVPDALPPAETPADKVRQRITDMARPADMIQCHRCGGREVIETKIGVMLKNGRPNGGTRSLLCAACFARGERVVLF